MTLDMFSTSRDGAVVREAQAARDAGIAQAEETAGPNWNEEADLALRDFLTRSPTFHVDNFAAVTAGRFATRAFGSVVQRAVRNGWMEPTSEYRPSIASHLAPKRVFASKLYQGAR